MEGRDKNVYWDEDAVSEATTKKGESYIGKTVYATDGEGNFRYGDQYGNWHGSAPLGEVNVTGLQSSGRGPVVAGMRNAAKGYDPGWIAGFHQFVDAGITAINLTLTATTLTSNSRVGGVRTRVALGTTGNAVKGGKAIVIGEGMGAVKTTAKTLQSQGINAKWYQAWSKNFPTNRLMTPAELNAAQVRNARWLNSKISQGYTIYDIGIDATRATRSPFYQLERSILQQSGYPTIVIPR